MEVHELPDLSGWRYIEIWTIEEIAMLWAAIDPSDHIGVRLGTLKNSLPIVQYKKAWISLRAVSEAVCGGTLPFVEAWELHDDFHHGHWEKKIEFPQLPDRNKMIHHMTRIRQAAFLKWAFDKKIPSYRQELQKSKQPVEQLPNEGTPSAVALPTKLELPAPSYLDPNNPLSPIELRAGVAAWKMVTSDGAYKEGKAIKDALRKALDEHAEYRSLSNDAKSRICTVTNWNKKGGAPKTPE